MTTITFNKQAAAHRRFKRCLVRDLQANGALIAFYLVTTVSFYVVLGATG